MTSDIEQALTDLIASNVDSINFTEFFTLVRILIFIHVSMMSISRL